MINSVAEPRKYLVNRIFTPNLKIIPTTNSFIGENLLTECKNLSYIRINPRKEYKTLKLYVEEGKYDNEKINENDKNLPIYLKKEIEFFQSQVKNELIEFRAGANEAISLIHHQIKQLMDK